MKEIKMVHKKKQKASLLSLQDAGIQEASALDTQELVTGS